jgi:hypothetical protein
LGGSKNSGWFYKSNVEADQGFSPSFYPTRGRLLGLAERPAINSTQIVPLETNRAAEIYSHIPEPDYVFESGGGFRKSRVIRIISPPPL